MLHEETTVGLAFAKDGIKDDAVREGHANSDFDEKISFRRIIKHQPDRGSARRSIRSETSRVLNEATSHSSSGAIDCVHHAFVHRGGGDRLDVIRVGARASSGRAATGRDRTGVVAEGVDVGHGR